MAKKTAMRTQHFFSESLRKDVVFQVESGKFTIAQACREYGICSPQSIYNWIYRYSRTLKKGTRIVMEKESQDKTNEELRKQIKQLEAALGRKSLEADLYRVIVEEASKEYKVDLKKSFGEQASEGPER
ncbi:MAG: transposase [Chitinophagaceae bacterium]|nr:MAG: transposase [Chitinophagaceae bacterium]